VAVVQVLDDGLDDLGGVGQRGGEALRNDLALQHELAALVGVDAGIIAGTSQNAHLSRIMIQIDH
jgi:hypothetical protein